jgi:hypothetical protein
MTQSEDFENRLAVSSDSFNLKGKFADIFPVTTTPNAILNLNSISLGQRSTQLSGVFSRYRINKLVFRFISGSSQNVTLGILDDSSAGEGDAPGSAQSVLEMRCSALSLTGQTVPTQFTWSPLDRSKWYYCTPGASGSDVRLSIAAVLYCVASSTAISSGFTCEIDYDITFKGAVDTGAN